MIQKFIGTLRENFFELGLEFSPLKTVIVHFNAEGIVPGTVSVRFDREAISSSRTVKFFGVFFDYHLTFTYYVVKRCQASVNIIKSLCGTWCGASPETLLILYKSYVCSILEYCIFVFYPASGKLLDRLQRI